MYSNCTVSDWDLIRASGCRVQFALLDSIILYSATRTLLWNVQRALHSGIDILISYTDMYLPPLCHTSTQELQASRHVRIWPANFERRDYRNFDFHVGHFFLFLFAEKNISSSKIFLSRYM